MRNGFQIPLAFLIPPGLSCSLPDPTMNLVRYVPVILRRPFWSLGGAASLAALIAIVDALVCPNLSLGFLYLLPLLLVAPHLGRRGLLGLSVGFGFLRESFAPFAWEPAAEERIFATFSAFAGVSLFVNELIRGRRIAVEFSRALEEQQTMRVEAEAQLTNFVESSPAAILTVGTDGRILQANQAAHQLFACDGDALTSEAVTRYLPTLHSVLASGVPSRTYRTTTESDARRHGGEPFSAEIWFSTFPLPSRLRLAAIVFDTSENIRDREQALFQRSLRTSRILVDAVRHEISNLCSAISRVQQNLTRLPGMGDQPEVKAIHTLVEGLARFAGNGMPNAPLAAPDHASVPFVLSTLRVIVDDTCVTWQVPAGLPVVIGESDGLVQVFLNLLRNALRAVERSAEPRITVSAVAKPGRVAVSVSNSGPLVSRPELLFQPNQQGAEGTGLGLFVSRAIVRSFRRRFVVCPGR